MEDMILIFSMLYLSYLIVYHLNTYTARRKRRWWVRDINLGRNKSGYYETMYKKMKANDPEQFFKHTRMDMSVYELLLSLMKDHLTKKSIRPPIDFECRLALTLTYLSQVVSYQYLAWGFHMGQSTVPEIILDTCEILWHVLSPIYVSPPNGHDFEEVTKEFLNKWQMPNCVGSIEGKHICITCPPSSGSAFFNYKKTFSIVLMAACDANYLFTYIDIGAYGSQSDGGVLQNSAFGQSLFSGKLPLPEDSDLKNSNKKFTHYFVADAAFPLKTNIMKPFPGQYLDERRRIFNYRLSRARRVMENSFGILVSRWRILLTTINSSPRNCEKIVLACIVLHNFIMVVSKSKTYCPNNYVDWEDDDGCIHLREWRNEVHPLRSARFGSNNATRTAFDLRDILADYFLNGILLFVNHCCMASLLHDEFGIFASRVE